MKKFFLMLLALMLAMTTLTVFAEEADMPSADEEVLAESALLQGFVMEVMDESILVMTRDGLYVEAFLNENTAAESFHCEDSFSLCGIFLNRSNHFLFSISSTFITS